MRFIMSQQLSYESAIADGSRVWRLVSGRSVRLVALLLIYATFYAALRIGGVLVHQEYLYLDQDNPGFPAGSNVQLRHGIGRGSFYDEHDSPKQDAIGAVARIVFYPFVKAESQYWHFRRP